VRCRHEQDGDLGLLRFGTRRGDQLDLVGVGEAVVERRAASRRRGDSMTSTPARSRPGRCRALRLGELVRHRVLPSRSVVCDAYVMDDLGRLMPRPAAFAMSSPTRRGGGHDVEISRVAQVVASPRHFDENRHRALPDSRGDRRTAARPDV